MKHISFIVIILIINSLCTFSQQTKFKDLIKAELIFNSGVYINWKDKTKQKEADRFVIGVYGSDSSMYDLLTKICRYRLLKWKKIKIVYFKNINEITYIPMLYVDNKNNYEIPLIDSVISKWSTLLITNSCNNFNGIMINFFPRNALKKVEINKENIVARGMKINPMFYIVAKKYEEDWEMFYQKSEADLAIEKETVEQQSIVLIEQEKNIKLKEEHILKLSSNISQKESELKLHQEKLANLQNVILEKNKLVNITAITIKQQQIELLKQQIDIKKTRQLLKEQITEYKKQKSKIDIQKNEISQQQNLIDSQKSKLSKSIADLKKQQLVLYFVLVVLVLIGILSIAIFRSYRIKKRANKILNLKNIEIYKQNTEITQHKEEIETQRDEIEAQRDSLARQHKQILIQNKDITDSITYASFIQQALLPPEMLTAQLFYAHFIFYLPRDIVSGDFYWARKKENITYIAVADCTGHGVPGAFMSMLGISFLNEIIRKQEVTQASHVLNELRKEIINALHQQVTYSEHSLTSLIMKEGMDISLLVLNTETNECQWAGANNPLYIVSSRQSAVGSRQLAVGQMD